MSTDNPVINTQLLDLVLDYVESRPQEHDQSSWVDVKTDNSGEVCGTTCCFAGHALLMSGDYKVTIHENSQYAQIVDVDDEEPVRNFVEKGSEVLGLTEAEANELFRGSNGRYALRRIVEEIKNGEFR